jgi:hypothetical protein
VSEDDGPTLVINTGPGTVFFGGNNAIRSTDGNGVVPITPNSYFAVDGKSDLYACVAAGDSANLSLISGGLNFFLPLTSLTIPYGATGTRITINPPDHPGSIVGYNVAGLIQFIISPHGYLIYDATGGALNHLFMALQNLAGSDDFGNPFIKGIQVGPQTGPQVTLGGGNPAFVGFPLNDAVFSSQPAMNGRVIGGSNPNRWGELALSGAQIPNVNHRDFVELGLNSPSADGSSFGNGELVWVDNSAVSHAWQSWDGGGIAIRVCQQLTASDPSLTPSPVNPAQPESWRDLRPLTGSFIGTISGQCPPQYRKCADGDVEIIGKVQFPAAAGNYNGIVWGTLLPAYRPNKSVQIPITAVADGAATPVLTINTNGTLTFNFMPASVAGGTVIGICCRFPLDSTGIIQS